VGHFVRKILGVIVAKVFGVCYGPPHEVVPSGYDSPPGARTFEKGRPEVKQFLRDPREEKQVREFGKYEVGVAIDFFADETIRSGRRKSTGEWYRSRLKRSLEPWLAEDVRIFEGKDFLGQWRQGILDSNSAVNANCYIRALKAFVYFLLDNDFLKHANPRRLEQAKVEKRLPVTLTEDEVVRLLATYDEGDIFELRDSVILRLIIDTGLRISEALGLTLDCVHKNSPTVEVRETKGRVDRTVAMSPVMVEVMTEWIRLRERLGEGIGDYLFPSRQAEKVSPNWFNGTLKKHAKAAGIKKTVSSKTGRFTFAGNFINEGYHPAALQKAMGHKTVHMSLHYARMTDATSHKQTASASMLNRIGNGKSKGGLKGKGRKVTDIAEG